MLLLGTVFWPWARGAPLTRPFQALLGAANFRWDGLVLFNGHEYEAPRAALVLCALVVADFDAAGRARWASRCRSSASPSRADALRRRALVVAALPGGGAIVMGSTLYDGIRHLLFIYPGARRARRRGLDRAAVRDPAARGCARGAARVLAVGTREHAGVRHPVPSEPGRVFQRAGRRTARRVRAGTTWTTGATACCRRWSGEPQTARVVRACQSAISGNPCAPGPARRRSGSASCTSRLRSGTGTTSTSGWPAVRSSALQELARQPAAAPGAHARRRGAVHRDARARLRRAETPSRLACVQDADHPVDSPVTSQSDASPVPTFSFVVPVYNEDESLPELVASITRRWRRSVESYEMVFVDDGSTDGTLEAASPWRKRTAIRVFSFRRNLGKSPALLCGFQKARRRVHPDDGRRPPGRSRATSRGCSSS